ncbi:hypothetical protein MKK68_02175 [Methylobacterium sp. E-016]|uniref:hypothetical protein n=1 Tax=Methylobacterium sp. E-016 TaxID=2836556 RepID=UPI001FBC110E|nr:hypothetical protein [Methylobacterium sp. E-016]MCJ2074468.1 hypothetical protein [Methylobacterium sp. E-016]
MTIESIIGVAKPSTPEEVAARRAEARERRIASARTTARPSGEAVVAQAGRGGAAKVALDPAGEVRALGELLYGERYTAELARDIGEDPRTVRYWIAGERAVPPRAMAWIRAAARRRAAALVAIIGAEAA